MEKGTELRKNICIKIDFEKNSKNPQRVFESMSHLISSIEDFHSCLLSAVSAETTSSFLLAEVKEGSIESWLCPKLEGDSKPETITLLANFLNICTDKVISFIEERGTITNIDELTSLENEISEAARELNVEEFPNVFSLDKHRLLKGYSELAKATENLNEIDEAYLTTSNDVRRINKEFHLSDEELNSLIIERVEDSHSNEVLVIKKADFIGRSMWDFIQNKVTISAKIRDELWLNKFHLREETVSPGDALRCDLMTYIYYDKGNNIVDTKYEVLKIHEKVEKMYNQQLELNHD